MLLLGHMGTAKDKSVRERMMQVCDSHLRKIYETCYKNESDFNGCLYMLRDSYSCIPKKNKPQTVVLTSLQRIDRSDPQSIDVSFQRLEYNPATRQWSSHSYCKESLQHLIHEIIKIRGGRDPIAVPDIDQTEFERYYLDER